eukprot:6500516-Lingulodinium_polyedra.AAC.1
MADPAGPLQWGSGGMLEQAGSSSPVDISGCTLYIDESGGAHSSDPRVRRCGWAVAILQGGAGG